MRTSHQEFVFEQFGAIHFFSENILRASRGQCNAITASPKRNKLAHTKFPEPCSRVPSRRLQFHQASQGGGMARYEPPSHDLGGTWPSLARSERDTGGD